MIQIRKAQFVPFIFITVVPLSRVRLPNTSRITAQPPFQPAPHTGEPEAPEPIPPDPQPEPIYDVYLLPAITVVTEPQLALVPPVPPAIPAVTQSEPEAVLPAPPPQPVPFVPADGLPLPPKEFTNHVIKSAPASQSLPDF